MLVFSRGDKLARRDCVIRSANSLCKANRSVISRSKVSDQMFASVHASMSWALTRTRLPNRRAVPSRICATPNATPISRRFREPLLNCCTEVRLITFRSATLARFERMSSCTPAAKYSFSLSSLKFSKGKTAILFRGICVSPADILFSSALTSSVLRIPCRVISKIHARMMAIGNPRQSTTTTSRTAQLGISKNGNTWVAIWINSQLATA